MTDKEKIRAEIERRIEELQPCNTRENLRAHGAIAGYYQILSFINSMQEEPASEKKCMFTKDSYTDEDRRVLCDDCKEKCEYSKKEEPVSEDLEVACEQLAENARKHKVETSSPFFSPTDYKQGVIDGANWQKEQLLEKAVDANCFGFQGAALFSFRLPADNYLVGSKVKIIIIKDN